MQQIKIAPKGTEPLFEHPHLKTHALFVDEPIDTIGSPHAYEYQAL